MNDYSNLLFELSSVDRLDILVLIRKTPLKLSHISRTLNFTVQETSRNLNRLLESELIAKNVDGTFSLTPYGEATFELLSGFRFLYKSRQYFSCHSISQLPEFFKVSLGILDDFELVNDVMIVFHHIENMIKNARDFVWIMTDQVLTSTISPLINGLQRGLEFRLLMPNDYLPSDDVRALVSNSVFEKASRSGNLETKFTDDIDVFLCLSEKEVAVLAFTDTKGNLDYRGFKTRKSQGIEWVKILFSYYWNKATSEIPRQLIQ